MKVLIDTDIGSDIDDALALLLLLQFPDFELVGLTTVYGDTAIRAKVAKKMLDAAGCRAPVVAGCGEPIGSSMPIWHAGTEGDGVLTPEERSAPLETFGIGSDAPGFIIDMVNTHGRDLTVVCLGALTNIASALRREPSLAARLGPLFFMGGGITFRDPVPAILDPGRPYRAYPSHNVRCDAVAAQEVFASGAPMTILTNDVRTQVWWDGEPVQRIMQASHPPEKKLVGKLLGVWLDYRSRIFKRSMSGTCPHDPLTVAEAMQPGFVQYVQGEMSIQEDAWSIFRLTDAGPHRAGAQVDAAGFLKWFSEMMEK